MLPRHVWGITAAVLCCLSPAVRAEVFQLANGGEVRGELVNRDEKPRTHYVVKTAEGGSISLPADRVKKVVKQSAAEMEYDRRAATAADTVKAQWDVAEFCREKHLAAQRTKHLERIIQLDPDNADARRALGYSRVKGEWITVEEGMDAQGRKRYQGAWRYPQEIALMERAQKESLGEKEWQVKLKRWRGWLTGGKADLARDEIATINDPLATRPLVELLGHENNHEIKLLWIDALARIGGPALDTLLTTSMGDGDEEVRIACLERLQSAHYKPAVIYYIQSLKAKENSTVNLAAVGLFYMKDTTAIPALIDALVTTHKQVIQPGSPPGQMSAGFGTGPGGNSGGSFNFGQQQPQVITREYQNQDVLRALAMLSGVNYEYDVPAWKRWYTNQKKSSAFDTRRDDP